MNDMLLISRRTVATTLLFALAASLTGHAFAATPNDAPVSKLAEVINGPQRSPASKARDAARHPLETLRFFGVSQEHSVIEVAPGGGWYTEILAPYLRERGRFYAAWETTVSPQVAAGRVRYAYKLSREPEIYGRAVLGLMPGPTGGFTGVATPGTADMVLTFRNIHNWIERNELDLMLRGFYDVLKPGGVLGIEEHRAPPGTPVERIIATGYVPEALVISRARAAGFELAGSSEINANPKDTKDYPNGVWSLPPTLRGGDVEREKFMAIGESDRMTLKFVKPR